MKILFAIKTLNTSKGGAERVLADIASDLVGKGHSVSILSFDPPKGQSLYDLDQRIHRVALGVGDVTRRASFREFITRAIVMRKAAKRFRPDVVVGFMHSTFIPMSFALFGTGVPVIASEHIVPKHYKDRWWEFALLSVSYFFVKKITVLSKTIISKYPFFLRSKMIAIPNPVKKSGNYSVSKTSHKILLNVGRLSAQKDQATLIKAFSEISSEFPEWKLKIIGEGELRDELEALVFEMKMIDKIELPGTTNQIDKEYRNADIFVLSSLYESFGLATAEAMAQGTPAIGFADCPGTNEIIIDNHNGLLVDPENNRTKALAEAMRLLMSQNELRLKLGTKAISSIDAFDPKKIADKWERLLESVATGKTKNGGQTGIRTLDGL